MSWQRVPMGSWLASRKARRSARATVKGSMSSALSGRAFPAASTWAKTTWTFSSVRPVDEKPGWGSGRTAGAMSSRSR